MTDNRRTISVELPEPIFRRLQHIANATQRSVEDVLATTVDVALPQTPGIPADIADDLAALSLLNDTALWTVANTTPTLTQHRLAQLTEDGKTRPLSDAEAAEHEHLIDTYDRAVLRRAKALAQRGFDVSASIKRRPGADERH
jgi:hypothetical protein